MFNESSARRRAGILLHPTSLPGDGVNGRIGAAAFRFVDFLDEAGFSVWQTLPVGPRDRYGSPYSSDSAFAGDLMLLDGPTLAQAGLLGVGEAAAVATDPAAIHELLPGLVDRLAEPRHAPLARQFAEFRSREAYWLEDYALYRCLRDTLDAPWYAWPEALRARDPGALADARRQCRSTIPGYCLGQFLFDLQWHALRDYARHKDILMFGDLSFFVAHDGADVWANQSLFRLDPGGGMQVETGVPPDYFSADGQLWHTPHFDWGAMRERGYRWWLRRMQRQSQLFDIVRIDHFRGLAAAWEVPPGAVNAADGQWVAGPGMDLLERLHREVGRLALAAEDLGYIGEDVRQLRRDSGLPGMGVFQFGFDGHADNPHLPVNCAKDVIYYTGTHDNDTLRGWYAGLDGHTRWLVRRELDLAEEAPVCAAAVQTVLNSRALLAMLPMQDVLCLGSEARMNTPGCAEGNWRWRLERLPGADVARRCRDAIESSARL